MKEIEAIIQPFRPEAVINARHRKPDLRHRRQPLQPRPKRRLLRPLPNHQPVWRSAG